MSQNNWNIKVQMHDLAIRGRILMVLKLSKTLLPGVEGASRAGMPHAYAALCAARNKACQHPCTSAFAVRTTMRVAECTTRELLELVWRSVVCLSRA